MHRYHRAQRTTAQRSRARTAFLSCSKAHCNQPLLPLLHELSCMTAVLRKTAQHNCPAVLQARPCPACQHHACMPRHAAAAAANSCRKLLQQTKQRKGRGRQVCQGCCASMLACRLLSCSGGWGAHAGAVEAHAAPAGRNAQLHAGKP